MPRSFAIRRNHSSDGPMQDDAVSSSSTPTATLEQQRGAHARNGAAVGGGVVFRTGSSSKLLSGKASPAAIRRNRYMLAGGAAFLLVAAAVWSVLFRVQEPDAADLVVEHSSSSKDSSIQTTLHRSAASSSSRASASYVSVEGFNRVLDRALNHSKSCHNLEPRVPFDVRREMPFHNDTVASLPAFGIVAAIENYFSKPHPPPHANPAAPDDQYGQQNYPQCHLPPLTECDETQLTVVFMAYNPDRLGITLAEIQRLLNPALYGTLVHEIVMVWNGERRIDESGDGVRLLQFARDHPVRIAYPLQMGFPNDLMNRYHPSVVKPQTRALLYYDDDGPFYSPQAIRAGFELWKRHSRAQVGAMARQITYSDRQERVRRELVGTEGGPGDDSSSGGSGPAKATIKTTSKAKPADDKFIPHCTNANDQVDYQFRFFANYDANMVLPSGSLLHASYLCYLWHPVLAEVRKFVLDHPVHPDDMTVSLVVSQLAGLAPRVYSRRLPPADKMGGDAKRKDAKTKATNDRRRLTAQDDGNDSALTARHDDEYQFNSIDEEEEEDAQDVLKEEDKDAIASSSEYEQQQWLRYTRRQQQQQRHRRLMFSICWDCGAGMTEMKQYWAELRAEAVNSLVRYFGSINSGSIGWCAVDSPYYRPEWDGRCRPAMAKQGWLPWMNPDGTPKATCP
jgi:Glycosyl transferase family 64 domain